MGVAEQQQDRAFRQRVALVFQPKQHLKTSSLLVYLTTFISLYAISTIGLPVVFTYFMLLVMSIMICVVWHANNPKQKSLLNIETYKLKNAIPQIMFGVSIVMVIFIPLLLVTGVTVQPISAGVLISQAIFAVAVVGAVEEFTFRWVFPQTMVYGPLIAPFLFAFMHPIVRVNWMNGMFPIESLFFFLFAVGASFFFYSLMVMRTSVPKKYRQFFGLTTATAAHGTMNVLVVVFMIAIGGIMVVPF